MQLVVLLGEPATLLGRGSPVLRAITAPEGSTVVNERITVPAALEAMTGLLDDVAAAHPVVAHVAPVASRVISYSGAAATVEEWTVSVLGTRRLGVVASSWSTETVSLAWRDGWQVTDVRARPGPTPAPAGGPVTSLPQFLEAVDGMSGYDDARR